MTVRQNAHPALVRWAPVIAGGVLGFALMVLLSSFWVAVAADATAVANNLHWYTFASAIVALFVAGLMAGWMSGVRGTSAGLLHGITVWALVLVAAVWFPFPQAFQLFGAFEAPLPEVGAGALWAGFLALLIGLVAAAVGGLIGGAMTRPIEINEPPAAREPVGYADPEQGRQPVGEESAERRGEMSEAYQRGHSTSRK